MMISLIVAAAENGVIGRGGTMPWHMPSDLKYFRSVTLGKPVIMGRKTFQSIGKPLPKRHNIVVSRSPDFVAEGADVVTSLDAAIARAVQVATASGVDEIMIIGGGQIYAAALPRAGRVYLTCIQALLNGDATFPALDAKVWHATSRFALLADPKDDYPAEAQIFERISSAGPLDATARRPT
jgi:dihydrofolate reductase